MRSDNVQPWAAGHKRSRKALLVYGAVAVGLTSLLGAFASSYYFRHATSLTEIKQERAPLVIVVNKGNPVKDLSVKQLARIYSGEITTWPDGVRITAINHPIESEVRERFFQTVFKKKQAPFFQPGSTVPFETMRADTESALVQFVARDPGAIAYCYIACVDDSIKVITIGGRSPEEEEYAFR